MAIDDGETFVRHYSGLYKLYDILGEKRVRDFKTHVTVLCGRPGTGKSRLAQEIGSKYDSVYYKTLGESWDNMPQNCDCVIIDDFYGWLKYDELLKILDRYPYQVPVKGSYIALAP